MSGRKKQPLAVIQGKGKSNHLTKEEIKKRQAHEEKMTARSDQVEPPSRLTKKQKEEFSKIAEQLMEIEIFDNLDVNTLAMYIETYDSYVRVSRSARSMSAKELNENFDEYAKRMRTMTQLAGVCRQLASDLGLTITSRLKLIIPENEDDKNTSPMGRFLNRRGNNG